MKAVFNEIEADMEDNENYVKSTSKEYNVWCKQNR